LNHSPICIPKVLLFDLIFNRSGIVHRDIKAANLFIDGEGQIKLGDFGVAVHFINAKQCTNMVGTPYWMAPEVIVKPENEASYDSRADIWSFGITLYELFKGNPPLVHLPPNKAIILIPQSMPPRLLDQTRNGLREIVNDCLHDDPLQRPTAGNLRKRKVFKNISNNSMNRILGDLFGRYFQRLNSIEPDRQSLISRISAHDDESDATFWNFSEQKQEEERDVCDEPPEEPEPEVFTVIEEVPETSPPPSLADRTRSNSIAESHLSDQSQMSISESQLSITESKPQLRRHRKNPSLMSLFPNNDSNENLTEGKGRMPGIYFDLVVPKGGSPREDAQARLELALALKNTRLPVIMRGEVDETVLQEQEAYIVKRLEMISKAIHMMKLLDTMQKLCNL
jgi:serine/threonine protein kinase